MPVLPALPGLVRPAQSAVLPIIRAALAEDLGPGDITSEVTIPGSTIAHGWFEAKARGVVAGLWVVELVMRELDPAIRFCPQVSEGASVDPGAQLAVVDGPAKALLSGERVALNFLQRLSGIATMAQSAVQAVAGTRAKIIDTRKTTPGLRVLEKYAVRAGGASNHRFGLYDMVLIKDNHIRLAGGIPAAVAAAKRSAGPMVKVEVEVATLAEVTQAVEAGADIIMLDNMNLTEMSQAVELIGGRAMVEASGNVTTANVAEVAATGVDLISMGSLTHSFKALDISLELELHSPA